MLFPSDLLDPAGKGGGLRFAFLGSLPVVLAGDKGTIPQKYCAGLRRGAHRFDPDLARADSALGSGDGWPMHFFNSWALGWSRDM